MQELFNRALEGLRAQGGPGYDASSHKCIYRSTDPTPKKCFAGHLIADEHYKPFFEGMVVDIGNAVGDALIASGVDPRHITFVYVCQRAHDEAARDTDGDEALFWPAFFSKLRESFDRSPFINVNIPVA